MPQSKYIILFSCGLLPVPILTWPLIWKGNFSSQQNLRWKIPHQTSRWIGILHITDWRGSQVRVYEIHVIDICEMFQKVCRWIQVQEPSSGHLMDRWWEGIYSNLLVAVSEMRLHSQSVDFPEDDAIRPNVALQRESAIRDAFWWHPSHWHQSWSSNLI